MASRLANGNHSEQCPDCRQFVPKSNVESGGPLKRVNCPKCGWGAEYDS